MSNKTSINIVICTKPLQWFNALNIEYPEQIRRYLIIIGSFSDSRDFYNNVKAYDNNWSAVLFADSRQHSYAIASKLGEEYNIERLYVDCDYGSIGNLYSKLPAKEMYVIEEGFGPYIEIVENSLIGKLKRMTFNLLGWGDHLGANKKTKGIYLYNPAYYKLVHPKNGDKVLKFNKEFYAALKNREDLLIRISNGDGLSENIQNKRVLFYITRYLINAEIIDFIVKNMDSFDRIIIKTHPHSRDFKIQDYIENIPDEKLIVIHNNTLAEVLISKLSGNNKLTVIHESSAACLYVDERKVEVMNVGKVLNEEFTAFKKLYLESIR